jgi:uncharacterized damage-inducible protein DinB
MNVAEVKESFTYNAWAIRRLFDALAALPTEQYQQNLKSSFGSIHGTVCHIVWSEQLWLNRWLGKPAPAVAQGKDVAGLAEARARWEAMEAERAAFLGGFPESRLTATIMIQPSGGGSSYTHTFREMFLHVVDHGSYHRGQIIAMLRQLGVKPPNTGMMGFFRERK